MYIHVHTHNTFTLYEYSLIFIILTFKSLGTCCVTEETEVFYKRDATHPALSGRLRKSVCKALAIVTRPSPFWDLGLIY